MGEHRADMENHTDDDLRRGIERADEQIDRVEAEDSDAAVAANREQRDAMRKELEERQQS